MSGFFGAPGMIIGVPTFAVIYTLIGDHINAKLKKKGCTCEDSEYCEGRAKALLLEAAADETEKEEKKKNKKKRPPEENSESGENS